MRRSTHFNRHFNFPQAIFRPQFGVSVARRLVRFASEDIGLVDPAALRIALDAKDAYNFIGLPEGKLALAQCVIYLAAAPKSNSVLNSSLSFSTA